MDMSSWPQKNVLGKVRKSFKTRTILRFMYVLLVLVEVATLVSDNIPVTIQSLVLPIAIIVIGSINSLIDSDDPNANDIERIKSKDAYMFPIMGCVVLCMAYALVKYAPKWIMDMGVRVFFVLIGSLAIQNLLNELIGIIDIPNFVLQWTPNPILGYIHIREYSYFYDQIKIPSFHLSRTYPNSSGEGNPIESVTTITIGNTIGFIIGIITSLLWYKNEHYIISNFIAMSLCIQAISFISLTSYRTASILLVLFFFYDIFWVFGTDVMVTVAKNVNAPIKLIFPRPAIMEKPCMLGLGDIVLPGIYIALLLRLDIFVTYHKWATTVGNSNSNPSVSSSSSPPQSNIKNHNDIHENIYPLSCVYHFTSLLFYIISLSVCFVIMFTWNHPQPALLYLVPGVLIPVLIASLMRKEFSLLWQYEESEKEKTP